MINTSPIIEIIEEIRQGKMVIVIDDEERENECDLVIPAEKVTPEAINFMAKYGRGLICLALARERCQQLDLSLMVNTTDARLATNFTVSIDASHGITTGISAHDRAETIRVAIAQNASPKDITQPGHIFPLMEQPGGVLTRAGHTEAGCDFARMAGFEPAAVIVEILNDDGTMARRKDIGIFAKQHDLKLVTVADLIRYRIEEKGTVHCEQSFPVTTNHGEMQLYTFNDTVNNNKHLALMLGQASPDTPFPVRVHVENSLEDLFGIHAINSAEGHWSIQKALEYIFKQGTGVLVLLRLPAYLNQQLERLAGEEIEGIQSYDRWQVGVGAQILKHLKVEKMSLMSSPKEFIGLNGFDLSIEEYIEKD